MTSLHSVDAANSAARGGGSEATEEPTNPSACQQRNDFSRNRRCGVSNHLLVRGRKSSQLRGACSHLRSSTRVIGTRVGICGACALLLPSQRSGQARIQVVAKK